MAGRMRCYLSRVTEKRMARKWPGGRRQRKLVEELHVLPIPEPGMFGWKHSHRQRSGKYAEENAQTRATRREVAEKT